VNFHELWRDLLPVGRDTGTGGYHRHAWTAADADCRAWFRAQAETRGLSCETDRNGNQWAWLGDPAAGDAVVTGSHLDSVPDGGAFDGPLGVVSAFAALDELRGRGATPARPLGVVNFADEEGARFGVACVGSRLAAGQLDPAAALALRDAEGTTLAHALEAAGQDPSGLGPDPERLGGIGAFVELHIEQGRLLADPARLAANGNAGANAGASAVDGGVAGSAPAHRPGREGAAVGVAAAIWPHGRWRFDFDGEANHAGTTPLADRRDPMLSYATTVLAARKKARLAGALATFGKVAVRPGGVNAIAARVTGWLDARAPDEATLTATVAAIESAARERGVRDGVGVAVARESFTPVTEFDGVLRDRVAALAGARSAARGGAPGAVPVLPTGAGHDAGILAAVVPTAMLFVRNPSGVSHSPAEWAAEDDCVAGVLALADVLEGLACG
jgi:N-carbamoyl-L-amino-acid hydrolase